MRDINWYQRDMMVFVDRGDGPRVVECCEVTNLTLGPKCPGEPRWARVTLAARLPMGYDLLALRDGDSVFVCHKTCGPQHVFCPDEVVIRLVKLKDLHQTVPKVGGSAEYSPNPVWAEVVATGTIEFPTLEAGDDGQ